MILKYFKRPKPEPVVKIGDREVCSDTKAGKREYYNRTRLMAKRQGELCAICGLFMVEPSFEHQDGRGMGAANRDDSTEKNGAWYNAAVHALCNALKGSRRYSWVNKRYLPVVERMEA